MVTKNLKSQENLGWTAGLRNMLHKENAKWWNWKSLAAQIIIWTVIVNSLVAMAVFILPQTPITCRSPGSGQCFGRSRCCRGVRLHA